MYPVINYIRLLRPHQYLKNLFIFAPLFFDFKFTDGNLFLQTAIAFFLFSAVASGVYIFNDLHDIEDDRKHPVKRNRPLASGAASKNTSIALMSALFAGGLALSYIHNAGMFYVVLLYAVLNIAYTLKLKHIAIIDVSVIAVGFVIRLFVGSAVTGIELSMWIILMTYLLALFLALAKRRDDLMLYLSGGEKARGVIDGYSIEMLNSLMVVMAAVVIVSYIMYTVSPPVLARMKTDKLYLTVIYVLLGIMRYMQITFLEKNTGSPTLVLMKDRFIQVVITVWLLTFGAMLYI